MIYLFTLSGLQDAMG